MSNARTKKECTDRHKLRQAGWDVSKTDTIQFNSGSETYAHLCLKSAAAYYLKKELNYRVDSEVENPGGEVDILAYGHPDRNPIVVEVETSPTEEVIADKIERYVKGQPVRDLFVLNPNDISKSVMEPLELVEAEL